MKIKVIGKQHRKGISKTTGRPYDFIEIHFNGPARGVEGLGALTFGLDTQQYSYDSITVGGDYFVEFDNAGYPLEFHPAVKA